MSPAQRSDKIRSAASQAAALAAARKDMRRYRYGQREQKAPTSRDISFGGGQTSWSKDK